MANLDIITEHIIDDAKSQADAIVTAAKAEYDNAVALARTKGKEEHDLIIAESQASAEKTIALAHSAAIQNKSMTILKTKVQSIDMAFEGILKAVKSMDFSEYETLLSTLLERKITKGKVGEIAFDKKDIERFSSAFTDKLRALSLTVVQSKADLEAGFILKYGDIEENCSVAALVRDKKEKLTDIISKELF